MQLADGAQPLLWNLGVDRLAHEVEALEDVAEHLIELVEVPFVFHQGCAGEVVEVLDLAVGHVGVHRLQQQQIFLQGDRDLGGLQLEKEGGEHGLAQWWARQWAWVVTPLLIFVESWTCG